MFKTQISDIKITLIFKSEKEVSVKITKSWDRKKK